MRYFTLILIFLFGFAHDRELWAQEMLNPYWDMQTLPPAYVPISTCAVTDLIQGNNYGNTIFLSEASASVGYAGASGNLNASLASRSGPLQREASGSAYVEFSVVPTPGYRFIIKSISFGVRSTQTGPQQWGLFQHDDQFASPLALGPLQNNSVWSWVFVDGLNYSAAKTINFRIYGFDGVGSPAINVANWRIDDLKILVQVVPENLPVKWLYQRLRTSSSKVVVEWGTGEELGADSFIVQRSFDAIRFEKLATIPAQSRWVQLPVKRFYQYEDPNPLSGKSFYRILQKDMDGTLEFGKVLTLEQSMTRPPSIQSQLAYFSSSGVIKWAGTPTGSIAVQLYSMNGHLVSSYHSEAVGGFLQLPLRQLARGYYVLVLIPVKRSGNTDRVSTIIYIP